MIWVGELFIYLAVYMIFMSRDIICSRVITAVLPCCLIYHYYFAKNAIGNALLIKPRHIS